MKKQRYEESELSLVENQKLLKVETLPYSQNSLPPSSCKPLTSIVNETLFNKHFKPWSAVSMEEEFTHFVYRGKHSGIYKLGCCPVLYQINYLPEIEEFCNKVYEMAFKNGEGSSSECHYHIFVTGMVKSGKTTVSYDIIPYLLSRKFGMPYTVTIIDLSCFPKCDNWFNPERLALLIIASVFGFSREDLTTSDCTSPTHNKILDFFNRNSNRMHFFVFDQMQKCDPETLSILKDILKSPLLKGKNFISIWTGGTQAALFRKLNMFPSSSYSFTDCCLTFNIPQVTNIENLQEMIIFLNYRHECSSVNVEFLESIKSRLGLLNCAYIEQICIYIFQDGNTFDESIERFFDRVFNSYHHDFKETNLFESLSQRQVLEFFKMKPFPNQILSNPISRTDLSCFYDKLSGDCTFIRDFHLQTYINLEYLFQSGVKLIHKEHFTFAWWDNV